MARSSDRPFLDRYANLADEESDHPQSIWPTYGRRRPPLNEWDDLVMLYGYSTDESDLAHGDGIVRVPPAPIEYRCNLCPHTSPTARGLTVHLSRRHGIKSARADYFASRKDTK